MEDMVMENLFNGIYKKKNVLITGNSGFKGSWLALWLERLGASVYGYSLPPVYSPSHFTSLQLKYPTTFANILDRSKLEEVLINVKPDIVFHLAAQAFVLESYREPLTTYETNVIGTLNVFEAARKCESVRAVINVTTDKVYENEETGMDYVEKDKLGGYDMYSSSKACSDIMTSSYRNSFFNPEGYGRDHFVLLASVRAGNVIGGGDWSPDRLIPDIVRAVIKGEKVKIRNQKAIRPWQHVLEPIFGYLLLGQKLLEGDIKAAAAWNFGPALHHCVSVETLLKEIRLAWKVVEWEVLENETFHEAEILKLNS